DPSLVHNTSTVLLVPVPTPFVEQRPKPTEMQQKGDAANRPPNCHSWICGGNVCFGGQNFCVNILITKTRWIMASTRFCFCNILHFTFQATRCLSSGIQFKQKVTNGNHVAQQSLSDDTQLYLSFKSEPVKAVKGNCAPEGPGQLSTNSTCIPMGWLYFGKKHSRDDAYTSLQ
ncbi:Peptidase S1 domain-containing protein, partial [Podarcis lilfordi]